MEKKSLKIAPDLNEIEVVGNVIECRFNGAYIRWVLCVDSRYFDDSDKEVLKKKLQEAIGVSSNKTGLSILLKKHFRFIHSEVYITKDTMPKGLKSKEI